MTKLTKSQQKLLDTLRSTNQVLLESTAASSAGWQMTDEYGRAVKVNPATANALVRAGVLWLVKSQMLVNEWAAV